jgi:hypothetical protein
MLVPLFEAKDDLIRIRTMVFEGRGQSLLANRCTSLHERGA